MLFRSKEENIPSGYTATITTNIGGEEKTVGSNDEKLTEGTIHIINSYYSVSLPSTGGSGVLPYTLLGGALIALALVLLINKQRKLHRG